MSADLPPFPWDWVASGTPSGNGQFNAYLVDATGRKLAAIWGKGDEKTRIADHILSRANAPDNSCVAITPKLYAFYRDIATREKTSVTAVINDLLRQQMEGAA